MLDAFVKDIESVDESHRDLYKQTDNGYVVDIKPVEFTEEVDGKEKRYNFALEDIHGLSSSLGKERNNRDSLEKELKKIKKEFDGVDPMELIGTKAQLEDLQKKYDELSSIDPAKEADSLAEKKVQEELAKKQKAWQKEYDKEVSSREERISGLTLQLHDLMVRSAAVKALAENGAGDNVDLLLPHILKSAKLNENEGKMEVNVVDGEGNPRFKADGSLMNINDLMPEFKEKWPNAFTADVQGGGGTPPSNKKPAPMKQEQKTGVDKINAGLNRLKK